jgi:acyl carrier protein
VSTLTVDEICDYFSSKGNPVSDAVLQTREFLDTFIKNVRVDYCCLETYPTTSKMLKTPLVVVGGELDQGVTIEDLKGWQKHRLSCGECEADFEGISRQDSPTRSISNDPGMRLYSNQGHFYLNDGVILEDLGVFVVETVNTICVTAANSNQVVEKEAEVKKHVVAAFRKALDMSQTMELLPNDHFFNDLGGTSLDTMILSANLQSILRLRITQDEFILNPTVDELTGRILELQMRSTNAPTLDHIEAKDGDEWFPASAGQVSAPRL